MTKNKKNSSSSMWATQDGIVFEVRPPEKKSAKLPAGMYTVIPSNGYLVFHKQVGDEISDLVNFEESKAANIVNEVTNFWSKKALFQKHKMPFKRGIMLYGPPGSGKSSIIKLITRNIIKDGGLVFTYNHYLETGLSIVRSLEPDTSALVIIEDIENWVGDTLIDFLDGHNAVENVVFLATTNYIKDIPETLRSRPSRFDRRVFVGPPCQKTRLEYLKFVTKNAEKNYPIEQWAKDTDKLTFAHLKELYIAIEFFDADYDETLQRLRSMMPGDFDTLHALDAYFDSDDEADEFDDDPEEMAACPTEMFDPLSSVFASLRKG